MENKKQQQVRGSSSSSSITMDLFGPKHSSSSSPASTGRFGSVFPPPSMVLGKETENKRGDSKDKSYGNQNQHVDHPCNFSSSIYYGGQDVFPPQTWKPSQPHPAYKKGEDEDVQNESNNSNTASRGNWWQGSLYY